MASKFLIMAEEANEIDRLVRAAGKNVKKLGELNTRRKALNARVMSYGKRGNLYRITFLEYELFLTEIDEADIPYFMNFFFKEAKIHSIPLYKSEIIPLGELIKLK